MERTCLHPLPATLRSTDRHLEVRVSKDSFVRVAGADYSVPPGLGSRRVGVRLSPTEVTVFLEGAEIARHQRSWVPADVILDPPTPGPCDCSASPKPTWKPATSRSPWSISPAATSP